MKIFIISIICLVVYALSVYFVHKCFQYMYRNDPDKDEPYTKKALMLLKLLPVVNTVLIIALVIMLFYVITRRVKRGNKADNAPFTVQLDPCPPLVEGGLTGVPEK